MLLWHQEKVAKDDEQNAETEAVSDENDGITWICRRCNISWEKDDADIKM